MKIRNGFVSNSSSSSFVIHRSYLKDDQVDRLETLYEKLKEKDEIYDDSDVYFSRSKNYVEFTGYGGDGMDKIWSLLKKFGIEDDMIANMDG